MESAEIMTDKQMEFIANLIADKFEACKDMQEVRQAVADIRNMARKETNDKEKD